MRRFLSFYGPGCCLLCTEPAVVLVGDCTGEAPVCATHQHQLAERSHGTIRVLGPYQPDQP